MKTIVFSKKSKRVIDVDEFCEKVHARKDALITYLKKTTEDREIEKVSYKLQELDWILDKFCSEEDKTKQKS
jgi:hypothetical protein